MMQILVYRLIVHQQVMNLTWCNVHSCGRCKIWWSVTSGESFLRNSCWCNVYTGVVQVGDPSSDHQCWERPEDMDTPRTAYKVDVNRRGSDVAAETAAALAAASMAFRGVDNAYSARLLAAARRVLRYNQSTISQAYQPHLIAWIQLDVVPDYLAFSLFVPKNET